LSFSFPIKKPVEKTPTGFLKKQEYLFLLEITVHFVKITEIEIVLFCHMENISRNNKNSD
jgi:hypothetical protein